jgi:integrase/recombinase XerD
LFRSTVRKTKQLTGDAQTTKDICKLVKRRLKDAGLPSRLSPHSFRVAAISATK